MIARRIAYTGDHATVVLEPGWLARLLGARTVSVDLKNDSGMWLGAVTGRRLCDMPHGEIIRDALDFREVGSPSCWALSSGAEAVSP